MGTGEMKDSTGTGEIVEQELLPLGMEDTMEEDEKSEGPSTEPQKAVEDSEESGGRRKIILSDLEKLHLSSLSLMGDTEAEPPPKPARLRLQAPLEAMLGVQAQVAWEEEEEEEEAAMEEGGWLLSWAEGPSWAPLCLNCSVLWGNTDLEESDSEEEEEEEGSDLGIVGELVCSGSSKPTGPTLSHTKASGMALMASPSPCACIEPDSGGHREVPQLETHTGPPCTGGTDEAVLQSPGRKPCCGGQFPSLSLPHALGCTGHLLPLHTPQAIQRRLEEIEVTFRELEQQGIKLEKFLREDSGEDLVCGASQCPRKGLTPLTLPCLADSPADQKTQWMNQLLYLVQKKNSLMLEESDLMIT